MHIQNEWPVGYICVSTGGGGDAGWESGWVAELPAPASNEAHGAMLPGSQWTKYMKCQRFPLQESVLGMVVTFLSGALVSWLPTSGPSPPG